MVKQTAGRDALGTFAPQFAALNDDVLFGEVWSREEQLPMKLRSISSFIAMRSSRLQTRIIIPFIFFLPLC